ncbi:hypothetical protein FALBO_9799 [Fusarium albosuccineum]|uniref:Apple domain-containing protein n=1 Tax=Fusarium albosuccineum TaxID=1237068 RepID=A0A8H4L873_9HYPO|nr:hypothetical protein FALBO_9799 [Fusarium albosuccineum]
MKTTLALLSVSLASAMATPVITRAQQCNVAPSAAAKTNIKPYDVASAATAEECQTICESDAKCQSFVYGLAESASKPQCLFYKVPTSQVPARSDGLHVFDKACAAKLVPTTTPTHAQPWGQVPKQLSVRGETQCNCSPTGSANANIQPYDTSASCATAEECHSNCEADDSCLSFLYGLLDNADAPVCKLYNVAASKVPARSDKLFVFDKGCSSKLVPVTTPTHDAPRGLCSSVSKTTKTTTSKVTKVKAVKVEAAVKVTDGEDKDVKVEQAKAKTTKVQVQKPKATKAAKVNDSKVKVTKVADAKPKATQVTYIVDDETKEVKAQQPKAKTTKAKVQQSKATKVTKVENNKAEDKEVKVTNVQENKTKVTEATKIENAKVQDGKVQKATTLQTKCKPTATAAANTKQAAQ